MKKEAMDVKSVVLNVFDKINNPDDRTGSIIKFLTPGVVSVIMTSLGFGIYSKILIVLLSVFGIDVNSIIASIATKIANILQSRGSISENEVTDTVKSAFDSGFGTSKAANMSIDTLLVKKAAGISDISKSVLQELLSNKSKSGMFSYGSKNVLTKMFIKLLVVILTSMGVLLTSEGVKHFQGKSSVFDERYKKEKSNDSSTSLPEIAKKLTESKSSEKSDSSSLKYKVKETANKSSHGIWVEDIDNDQRSIEDFVIDCARDSFDIPSVSDSAIRATGAFRTIVSDIVSFNSSHINKGSVVIPSEYKNELTIGYLIVKELS